ncbi:MAG: hypothetical protein RIR14_833, partial [Pseudomonadota bacterium]
MMITKAVAVRAVAHRAVAMVVAAAAGAVDALISTTRFRSDLHI